MNPFPHFLSCFSSSLSSSLFALKVCIKLLFFCGLFVTLCLAQSSSTTTPNPVVSFTICSNTDVSNPNSPALPAPAASNEATCWSICQQTSGCSFAILSAGQCYMKSSNDLSYPANTASGRELLIPLAYSCPSAGNPIATFNLCSGIGVNSDNIAIVPSISTASACWNVCQNTTSCAFAVWWTGGTCFPKYATGLQVSSFAYASQDIVIPLAYSCPSAGNPILSISRAWPTGLTTGQYMSVGDYIPFTSSVNPYFAVLQGDGNFCIYPGVYGARVGISIYCLTASPGLSSYFAILQGDGNFCVSSGTGPDHNLGGGACSGVTNGGGGFTLTLGYCGVLTAQSIGVSYWRTPADTSSEPSCFFGGGIAYPNGLLVGGFLRVGDYIPFTPLSLPPYFAVLQSDGNFCVYPGIYGVTAGPKIWCLTARPGLSSYFAILQGDGNFCVSSGTGPDHNLGGGACSFVTNGGGGFTLTLGYCGVLTAQSIGVSYWSTPADGNSPVTCQLCPPGTFSNTHSTCLPCPPGTFNGVSGASSCVSCANITSALNVVAPYEQTFVTFNEVGSTTCLFNGPICAHDNSPVVPGLVRVSDLLSGEVLSLDMLQMWGVSGWIFLQSKVDRQVLFSFAPPPSSNHTAFLPGDFAVLISPQDYYFPVEILGADRANSNSQRFVLFGSEPLPLKMSAWNWFMITYDPLAAMISFTLNSAVYQLQLANAAWRMTPLAAGAVFTPGQINFASPPTNPLQGGNFGPFRLYTPPPFFPKALQMVQISQGILPLPTAQATGCASDLFPCPSGQTPTLPGTLRGSELPYCACQQGFFLGESSTNTNNQPCVDCPANYFCDGVNKTPCPAFLPLSNPLSFLSSQCFANATNQYISPVALPNVDMCGRGYDLLFGSPQSTNGPDPGLRDPVFDLNYFDGEVSADQRYVIPKGTSLFEDVSCTIDFQTQTFTSERGYATSLANSVSLDVEASASASASYSKFGFSASVNLAASYAFQGSNDYEMVREGTSSGTSVYSSTSAECTLYTIFLNPLSTPLTKTFSEFIRSNLQDLANNGNSIGALVLRFGSHVPKAVTMGSRYGQLLEVRSTYLQSSSSDEMNAQATRAVSASAGFSASGWGFSASGSASYAQTDSSSTASSKAARDAFTSNITNQYTFSVGSTPPPDGNAQTWASQSIASPAVISMQNLVSLDLLLDPAYFPDLDPTLLNNAAYYLFTAIQNRCPWCVPFIDDYDVCFGGFVVNGRNTMTKTNGCPGNYLLTANLVPENNNWGLKTLQYCYHQTRCKSAVPNTAPTSTSATTDGLSSFGGAYTQFEYWAQLNSQQSWVTGSNPITSTYNAVMRLLYLTDPVTGNPYIDLNPATLNLGNTGTNSLWDVVHSLPFTMPGAYNYLFPSLSVSGNYPGSAFAYGPGYYPFFDQGVSNSSGQPTSIYMKSAYQMTGNVLANGQQLCPYGFTRFFVGVMANRVWKLGTTLSNDPTIHAHLVLYICMAVIVQTPQAPSPASNIFPCSVSTTSISSDAPSTQAPWGVFRENRLCGSASNLYFPSFYPNACGFYCNCGVVPPSASTSASSACQSQPQTAGMFSPAQSATLGGIFARGSDTSFIVQPGSPASALYTDASVNWAFNGVARCPPGYFEHILFTTVQPIPLSSQEPFTGSSDVVLCLRTSRSFYQGINLGSSLSNSIAASAQHNPVYQQEPLLPVVVDVTQPFFSQLYNSTVLAQAALGHL